MRSCPAERAYMHEHAVTYVSWVMMSEFLIPNLAEIGTVVAKTAAAPSCRNSGEIAPRGEFRVCMRGATDRQTAARRAAALRPPSIS